MRPLHRFFLHPRVCVILVLCWASVVWASAVSAYELPLSETQVAIMLDVDAPFSVSRVENGVPGWTVSSDGRVLAHIASTWEIAESIGYSGRPLEVMVAISPDARILGALLVRHSEPVLTLGISDEDIATYVSNFSGHDLRRPVEAGQEGLPDVISRATVSTGVIRDGILRTARTLAAGRGLIATGAGMDRLSYQEMDWEQLLQSGALAEARVTMAAASRAFEDAKVPVQDGPGDFLRLWTGLVDPPTVGQNLLGQQVFTSAVGSLGLGETALVVISSGLYSHRGTAWRRSGAFDRLTISQGSIRHRPSADTYHMVKRLSAVGAPDVKEISLFRLPKTIDPMKPIRIEVHATRPAESGEEIALQVEADYVLPERFRAKPIPEPKALWISAWRESRIEIILVGTMLFTLALVMLLQEWIVRRPKLWRYGRIAFLSCTFLALGWGVNGQLSVVQLVAFLQSLLSGFRWETFLIEPVIFLLWSFVALGVLFWGRGIYCGWLCPFGALQELLNTFAVRLGVKQVHVPQALHERLWIFKYTAFVAIVALSFYSMRDALVLAEVEPFKTAISMRMMRAWPFVLFVVSLLVAGLFIERFYCRYLCPLGAGLAIPSKLKVFDWLHRRPQCGRECRMCETKCTVGAIDSVGRINPNECVLCLRCQVIMNDEAQCPVLKRRARNAGTGARG